MKVILFKLIFLIAVYSSEAYSEKPFNILNIDFLKIEDGLVEVDGKTHFQGEVLTGMMFYKIRNVRNRGKEKYLSKYLKYEDGLLIDSKDEVDTDLKKIAENFNEDEDTLLIDNELYTGVLKFRDTSIQSYRNRDTDKIYRFHNGKLVAKKEIIYDFHMPYARNLVKRMSDWDLTDKRKKVKYFNPFVGGLKEERVYSYDSKNKFSETRFKDGVITQKTDYDGEGNIVQSGSYNSFEGSSFRNIESYDVDGKKQQETTYTCSNSPSFQGKIKSYYNDFKNLQYEIKCLEGKKQHLTVYFFNGNKSSERYISKKKGFIFSYWEGVKKRFYTNGNLQSETFFEEDNKFVFLRLNLLGSGTVFMSWEKYDDLKKSTYYYETGELKAVNDYSNSKNSKYYDKKGNQIYLEK